MKNILAVFAAVLVLLVGISGCGRGLFASSEIVIHVGHVLAPNHPYQQGLDYFKELVETRSEGRISVETFHSSQLGNERDLMEGLQLGTIEMALLSTSPLSAYTSDFYVFDLPFIFPDAETARKVLDGEIGQEVLETVSDQGVHGLCYFENGFRNVTNSKHPINHPEDLKGLHIRTMENPVHMDTFRVLGAYPTPMAFGELFTALQQKTIDAQENPLAVIDSSKFYEVQEYLSLTQHFYVPAPLLVSDSFYESLSPEDQQLLLECAEEARDYERKLVKEGEEQLVVELANKGIAINEIDKDEFRKAVQPVYDKHTGYGKDQISPELLERVQEASNQ